MVRRKGNGSGKEPSDERRAVVLFERLESRVKLLGEGHTGLVKRVNEFQSEANKRFDSFEVQMYKGFNEVWEAIKQLQQRKS